MATSVIGRGGRSLYVNSGYLKNSLESDEYDDDGRFSDDEGCDAKLPPPPVTKNFTLKPAVSSPSAGKFDLKAQHADRMDNGIGKNESATADQPLYNVPAKKSATPKLKKSASVHPRVKPPPPPVATAAASRKLTKSPSCGNNNSVGASKSSQCGRFNTFADKSANENEKNVKIHQTDVDDMNWFHGYVDRKTAEKKLLELNEDGSFLLRHKSDIVPNVPYALSVLHKAKVYHLEIRQKRNGHFALGDIKDGEAEFSCLQSLVCYYRRKPLQLIKRSTSEITGSTILTVTPEK